MLYNLCEWPSRQGSRLAVIGIANTLDLPERLMPRIASRLGSRRVVFQPYQREQLQAILSQRLLDAGVAGGLEENAIKYAARMVRPSGPRLASSSHAQASHSQQEAHPRDNQLQPKLGCRWWPQALHAYRFKLY